MQRSPVQHKSRHQAFQVDGWSSVLERALEAYSGPGSRDGLQLFLERREDLLLEAGSDGELVSRHNESSGLAARAPFALGGEVYVSDPSYDDAEALIRAVHPPRIANHAGEPPEGDPDRALDTAEAAALVSGLVAEVGRMEPETAVRARWVGSEQQIWVAQPDRPVATDLRQSARIRLEAALSRGDRRAEAVVEAPLRTGGEIAQRRKLLERMAESVVTRVRLRLDAREAPAGERAVVFAPGVGGVVVHELVGHALEADAALAGSWLASAAEPVSPAELTVVDDPRRGRAAWRLDDEGERSRATPLLMRGRVANWLHDQRTARETRSRSTGHGRRASFREPVRPRMGCTFVAAGGLKPEEILRDTVDGIYVRRLECASTDPRSGTATFLVTDADRLEQGRLDHRLRPCLLLIDARQALVNLDRIADDLAFDTCVGACHRDGQPLATSVGAPTIRLRVAKVIV